MGIALKSLAGLALATLLTGCAVPRDEVVFEDAHVWNYPSRVLLKNWTLSMCLANIAKDRESSLDAAKTANGYAEYGVLSVEERDELLPLIHGYVGRKYTGRAEIGEKSAEYDTGKCIDMFYSAELDAMVGKLLKQRSR